MKTKRSFFLSQAQHASKVVTLTGREKETNYAYVCKPILQLYTTLLYIEDVRIGYYIYLQANVQYYYTYDWLRGTYIVD